MWILTKEVPRSNSKFARWHLLHRERRHRGRKSYPHHHAYGFPWPDVAHVLGWESSRFRLLAGWFVQPHLGAPWNPQFGSRIVSRLDKRKEVHIPGSAFRNASHISKTTRRSALLFHDLEHRQRLFHETWCQDMGEDGTPEVTDRALASISINEHGDLSSPSISQGVWTSQPDGVKI